MLIRNKDKAKSKEIRGKVNGTSGKITAEYDEITIMVEIEEEEENLGITPNHNAKTVEKVWPQSHGMLFFIWPKFLETVHW